MDIIGTEQRNRDPIQTSAPMLSNIISGARRVDPLTDTASKGRICYVDAEYFWRESV